MNDEQIEKGAEALWTEMPYLMEDYSREWFYKAARIVLEAAAPRCQCRDSDTGWMDCPVHPQACR